MRRIRWANRWVAISWFLFLVSPLLANLEWVRPFTAFRVFLLSLPLGLLGWLWGWKKPRSRFALGLGWVPLALVSLMVRGAGQYPRINDVATSYDPAPEFVAAPRLPENQGRDFGYSASDRELAERAYPDLKPLVSGDSPDVLFERAVRHARQMPDWQVTEVDPSALRIEGVATSRMFRFKDDFVIRVAPLPKEGSRLEMRSKSRDGKGDLGANAERIRAYLRSLSAAK